MICEFPGTQCPSKSVYVKIKYQAEASKKVIKWP